MKPNSNFQYENISLDIFKISSVLYISKNLFKFIIYYKQMLLFLSHQLVYIHFN